MIKIQSMIFSKKRLTKMALCAVFVSNVSVLSAQKIDKSYLNPKLSVEERAEILVSQMTIEEKIDQLHNTAPSIERLGVPQYDWWNEALHGMARNGKATIFPQPIGMGATFDPALIERVADAISTEARAKYSISQAMGNRSKYAGLTFWSPTVNLYRDPRYGRGQECYGEDPYHMSQIGVAFVKGLQGNHPTIMKAAACAKHFVMHSGPEEGKFEFDVRASAQDVEESYMPAFKALVQDAKVEGVMAAYNIVNGESACVNKPLLTDLLREKWGFDGYITSDCGAVARAVNKEGRIKSPAKASFLSLQAGVNLNCGNTFRRMKEMVKDGTIDEKLVHDRCVQLFKTRFRLGFFDPEESNPYQYGEEVIHSEEHVRLAREVAQKSIVLLKNKNNVLPLSPEIKIPYITGPFANSNDVLMGSYYGVTSSIVTILEGVTDAVSLGTSLNYRLGALPFHKNPNHKNFAPNVAAQSDATICVVGTSADMAGEGVDAIASSYDGDNLDLRLPENQRNYILELIKNKKKGSPFILVIASGSAVTLEGIEEHCDAILQIWYPGEQGGNAVADVLFGKVSPSGRLPITFPKNEKQLPDYNSYSMQGRTYKYMSEEPMFPFGFGLSYSKSVFSDMKVNETKLNQKSASLEVELNVANVGNYNNDEVVQLYICPEKVTDGIPMRSLKAFKRVSLLKGDTQKVSFSIPCEDLKVVDEKGNRVWRKGNYKVVVGNSSPGDLSVRLGAAEPMTTMITLK